VLKLSSLPSGPATCVMTILKVAVIADFLEERWPSMDLAAEVIVDRSCAEGTDIAITLLRPRFIHLLSGIPGLDDLILIRKAERAFNRYVHYPIYLIARRRFFDLFHLVDHSYSHLLHYLPADSAVVTCHDLETFKCILDPARERRGPLFRAMTRHVMSGFWRAAKVISVSRATRDAIAEHSLQRADKIVVIPNAVHPAFSPLPDPPSDAAAAAILGSLDPNTLELLHVGSTEPRKRIDVLLPIFAGVLQEFPGARLIRVGGDLTASQRSLARELGVLDRIVEVPFVDREVLAAIYRRASLVLLPSDAEGFGLPLLEAMACGQTIVSSDLAVLREVGDDAVIYCPVGGVANWISTARSLLRRSIEEGSPVRAPNLAAIARAQNFSWNSYAAKVIDVYRSTRASDALERNPFCGTNNLAE
jgi:glycosyltransferase involved in cell wall biosynthesis